MGGGRYLVQPSDLGHIGDSVGAVLVIVGNHLGLLGKEQVGSQCLVAPMVKLPLSSTAGGSGSHLQVIPVPGLWTLVPMSQ